MLVLPTTWLNYNSQLSPYEHAAITIMMDRNSYISSLNYKEMYWNIYRFKDSIFFCRYNGQLTFWGEMCKLSKPSAYLHEFACVLTK